MHRSSVRSREGADQELGRFAAWSTAVAGVIAIGSGVLFISAADFHIDRILEPAEMLGSSSSQAELFRWAALTDMAGYYLLLMPLFLAVRRALHSSGGGIVDLATVTGLMYALAGGATAVVLAFTVPPLLEAYLVAEPAARSGPASAFTVVTDVAYRGIWQTLDPILIGTWALGTGLVLRRSRSSLGAAGITLGVISLIASALRMSGIDLGSSFLLVSAAIWAAAFWLYVGWLALHLARGSLPAPVD